MQFLIIFILALATASAFNIRSERELKQRALFIPFVGAKNEGRITNGETAKPGQFPYYVLLSIELSTGFATCGGALISSTYVVTAAHCAESAKSIEVLFGATVSTKPEDKRTVQKKDITIHPGWNGNTLANDIAMLKFPLVPFSVNIRPITLPNPSSSYSDYAGAWAIASGFGIIDDAATSISKNLKYGLLQVITNAVCQITYGAVVTSSKICTSTENKVSTCNGDSGGPLVDQKSAVLIGVTSFGAAGGCAKGSPVAFTRISSFMDWIMATMN